MTYLDALILAVVQGLTEFLPVSSSGHLVLAHALLDAGSGAAGPAAAHATFDVLLHGASLGAVLVAFRRDLWGLVAPRPRWRLIALLAAATVPAAALGALAADWFEAHTRTLPVVGAAWMLTALVLLFAERRAREDRPFERLDGPRALAVGLAQAAALTPGLSRSGATIAAALALGFEREAAVRLSFLMAVPIIGGAAAKKALAPGAADALPWGPVAAGCALCFVVSLAALGLLRWLVRRRGLRYFAWYLLPLGLTTLIWAALRAG